MKRLFVAWLMAGMVMFAVSGCGGKGSDNSNTSVFPTAENKIVDGTAVATVTVTDGIQMQAISGQVIAEFYDTATHSDYINLETFLKEKGFRIIGQIPVLHMVQIGVISDDQIVPLTASLKNLPYIQDAYPNMIVSSTRDPNPVKFTGSSWLDDISAKDAWNISIGKREIVIGIVDSDVVPNNAQFKKNNVRSLNEFAFGDEHGLEVASIAIANGDDAEVNGTSATNMAGVCWGCSLVAYDDTTGIGALRFGNILKVNAGIGAAIDAGAKVINISQDIQLPVFYTLGHEAFKTAIKQSVKLAHDKGVLLVFGAGNKPEIDNNLFVVESPEYESYWKSNVIVVTGSQRSGTTDSIYTEFVTGKVVDIAAPCLGISTAAIDGSVIDYNGTSYAAPMVTGTAGLIWSMNGNLSPSEVKAIITDPKNTNPTNNSTIRVLNVYRALTDPRVSGIRLNGLALAVLTDGSYGVFAGIEPMKFSQAGSVITVSAKSGGMLPNGTYSEKKGTGLISGNAVDISLESLLWYKAEVSGTAYRSTLLTGDLSMDGKPGGKARFDILPVDEVLPVCTGMGNAGILRLAPGAGVIQPFTVMQSTENPSVLTIYTDKEGGGGWLSGNQIFLNFVNAGDGPMKVTILKGTMTTGCGSAEGVWETFPFESDIPVARGPWTFIRQ